MMLSNEDASGFAKSLFLEDRDFPVDTVLQMVKENCNRSLSLEEVEEIRKNVLTSINRAMPLGGTFKPVVPTFTNRPRLALAKQTEKVPMVKRGRAQVDVTEKRQWLDKWLFEQPRIPTIKEAQAALKEHFGEALGTTFVANRLTEYHEQIFKERKQPESEPTVNPDAFHTQSLQDAIKLIANLMRTNGIKKIAVDEEDGVNFEAALSKETLVS